MKRFIAFFLALVCLVTMLPMSGLTSFAAEGNADAGTGTTQKVTGSGLSTTTVVGRNDAGQVVATWTSGSYKIGRYYAFCVQPHTTMVRDDRRGVSWRDYVDPWTGKKLDEGNMKSLVAGMQYIQTRTDLTQSDKYNFTMCIVWQYLSYTWGWNLTRTSVAHPNADAILAETWKFMEDYEYQSKHDCELTFWPSATGQNLVTFSIEAKTVIPPEEPEIPDIPDEPGDSTGYFKKASILPAITNDNRMYTIEGAEYGMYADPGCRQLLEIIRFDKKGNGGTISIPAGTEEGTTYYFREITAPKGYYRDTSVQSITVYDVEQTYEVSFKDEPASIPLKLLLEKKDANTNRMESEGDGTLKGAIYGLYYWDVGPDMGVRLDTNMHLYGDYPTAYWELATDAQGEIFLDPDYLVDGDPFYYDHDGYPCLPLGTYLLYEISPPTGYLISGQTWTFQVLLEDDFPASVKMYWDSNQPIGENAAAEMPIMGGVRAQKWDKELDLSEAIGGKDFSYSETGAYLEGIEFTIRNNSKKYVQIDGVDYERGQDICKLYTKWDNELRAYTVETDSHYLPFGTYTICETATNDAYLLTDGTPRAFEIREDGVIVTADKNGDDLVFKDYVKRQDIEFDKILDGSSRKLSVAFEVRNVTTNECHILVTDINGETDTSANWNPHTLRTNINDRLYEEYVDQGIPIPTEMLDTKAGIWFGLGENGHWAEPRDDFGALPYGDYVITELPCEENVSLQLLEWEFRVERNNPSRPIDLGTNTDDLLTPTLKTSSLDAKSMSKLAIVEDDISLFDVVHMENLQVGGLYSLTASFYDYHSGDQLYALDEDKYRPISGTVEFVADEPVMDVRVDIDAFDGNNIKAGNEYKSIKGTTGVVFEELTYYGEHSREVHVYDDFEDQDQWIYFPSIGTTAIDADTRDNSGVVGTHGKIIDLVEYKNLFVGEAYTLLGILMDKETEKPYYDKDDNPVVSGIEFVPEAPNGVIELEYDIDTSKLGGKTLVVFEELYLGEKLVAAHTDINDEGQSIHYPIIGTSARDKESGNHIGKVKSSSVIIDRVDYKNLTVGKKYTISGVLMDKDTGEALLDAAGEKITSRETFIPEEKDGYVELSFVLDTTELEGHTVVVFEDLIYNDVTIAIHHDIEDSEQSVIYEPEEPEEEEPKDESPREPEEPKEPQNPPRVTTGTPLTYRGTPKTGDGSAPIGTFIAMGMISIVGIAYNRRRRL